MDVSADRSAGVAAADEDRVTSPTVNRLLAEVQFGNTSIARREAERLLQSAGQPVGDRAVLQLVVVLGRLFQEGPAPALDTVQELLATLDADVDPRPIERGYLLEVRAHLHVLLDRLSAALEDMIAVEAVLEAHGTTRYAFRILSMNLSVTYSALSLYPLARDHLEGLIQPYEGLWREADQMLCYSNLALLHMAWARELERAGLAEGDNTAEYTAHIDDAERWSVRGLTSCDAEEDEELRAIRGGLEATYCQLLAYRCPEAAVGLLRSQLATDRDRGNDGLAAETACALSLALRRSGQAREALVVAEQAVAFSSAAEDSIRFEAMYQQHRASLALGYAGSEAADDALRAASLTIWRHRQQDVESVQGRREMVVLRGRHQHAVEEARQDSLTGAGNRRALDEWLAQHPTGPATLFLIDLDHFKVVNDCHGHDVGDRVLRSVADALRTGVRESDLLARIGGDEFVIACDGIVPDPAGRSQVLAAAMARASVAPMLPAGTITGSIGYATARAGDDTAGLFKEADQMMFQRKNHQVVG